MTTNMKLFNVQAVSKVVETLLDGEPVFIIRAQDAVAIPAIQEYLHFTKLKGGKNESRVLRALEEIKAWQAANPGKVKVAD